MGYRNNYNNNWGNPNSRGGYPQQGGYYNPNQDFNKFNNPNMPFEIGQRVMHRATKTELTVISYGREQIECRLPDLRSDWFYLHELEPISMDKK